MSIKERIQLIKERLTGLINRLMLRLGYISQAQAFNRENEIAELYCLIKDEWKRKFQEAEKEMMEMKNHAFISDMNYISLKTHKNNEILLLNEQINNLKAKLRKTTKPKPKPKPKAKITSKRRAKK